MPVTCGSLLQGATRFAGCSATTTDQVPVRIDKKFKKRLEAKAPDRRAAVLECIERIVDDPNNPGLNTHPIRSFPGMFASRVDRGNRVSWYRDGDTIVLSNHCNHDDVYRRP